MSKVNHEIFNEQLALSSLKRGEHLGFDMLFHEYRSFVYTNALRMVKDREYALEIVQNVFLRIWSNRSAMDIQTDFKSYLFIVTRNIIFDFFRKTAQSKEVLEKLESHMQVNYRLTNSTEEYLFLKDAQENLQRTLALLPPKCKEVFILCKIEGLSYDEVSKKLNISKATINNHIVKGTKILKKAMDLNSEDDTKHVLLLILFLSYYL